MNSQPAFSHHLLQVAVRKLVAAVPSDAQENDGWFKMPPLEGVCRAS
jgi:hypothetical protein